MANIKEQIIDWFNSPQDYDQGMALLQVVSKKNKVIGKLIRRGETRGSSEKLVWELNKIAGLKKVPEPTAKSKVKLIIEKKKEATGDRQQATGEKEKYSLIGDKDINSYPPEVNRLVKEYSSLYMQRGKKHAELKKLGDGNDQDTITARQPLIADIKKLSHRMEILFAAFDCYEKDGVEPDSEFLWPEEKATGGGLQATGSIEELKAQKQNLQSSLTKDRNMILYGSKTQPKNGRGNPVPAGPKRTILEKRILKKEKEIEDLNQLIADLT